MNTSKFEKKIEINFWFEYTEELESLSFEERELLEEQAKESIFNLSQKTIIPPDNFAKALGIKNFMDGGITKSQTIKHNYYGNLFNYIS